MSVKSSRVSLRARLLIQAAASSVALMPLSAARPQTAPLATLTSTKPAKAKAVQKTASAAYGGQENLQVVGTRSRPLQHESLPATVFTQREIERAGIVRPQDFMELTPGVSMVEGNDPSNSQISIRGVSQTYSETAESPIGVILDGVPEISPADFNQDLFDLQTIEVVKGPQNAIYGRNAIGGAIVINTLPPPEQLHGSLLGGISNGGGYRTVAKVGGPIIPDLVTASLVATDNYLNGFYKNITTDKKIDFANDHSLTGRVYITPTPDLTIDLKAGWVSLYGGGLAYHAQTAGNPYYTGGLPDVNNVSEPYVADIPNLARTLKNNTSMRIDYQMPFGKISSVSSYEFNKDIDHAALFPYLPAPLGQPDGTQNTTYSTLAYFQELKFISEKLYGLRYQFGADYYDFKRAEVSNTGVTFTRTQYSGSGPFPADSANPTTNYTNDLYHTKAWELFAEATYDITSKLVLDGAIRYSRNDITDANEAPAAYTSYFGEIRGEAYSKAEPRVTLTYKLTPDTNIYADWALGSLPGGFNPTGSSALVRKSYPDAVLGDFYSQETSRNVEAGFNSQWFDRRLTLNGVGYYDLLTNQQYDLYYPLAGVEVIDTIDKVRIFGGELQVNLVPVPGWTVTAGVGLADAKIEGFAADPTAVGNRPPYTPDYNLSFALERSVRFNDWLTGYARFEDTVKGTEYWEANNIPGGRNDVINLANVRVGIETKRWMLTGFVRNLADNRYNESSVVLAQAATATYLAPPRIYGAEFTVKF